LLARKHLQKEFIRSLLHEYRPIKNDRVKKDKKNVPRKIVEEKISYLLFTTSNYFSLWWPISLNLLQKNGEKKRIYACELMVKVQKNTNTAHKIFFSFFVAKKSHFLFFCDVVAWAWMPSVDARFFFYFFLSFYKANPSIKQIAFYN